MELGWSDGSCTIVIPNSKKKFIKNFKNHLKYKILNNIKMCLLKREKRKKMSHENYYEKV